MSRYAETSTEERMSLDRRHWMLSSLAAGLGGSAAAANGEPLVLAAESFPPFSQMVEGQAQGLDWDVVQAVLSMLGLTARLEILPWKRALLDLEQGLLDGLIGVSPGDLNEREVVLAFPDEPLSGSHSRFFYRRAQPFVFDGLFTLKGKRISVLTGYQYPPDFNNAPYFQRDPSATHEQSLRKLLAQRVDLALVHAGVGEHLLQREGWASELAADPTPIAPGRLYVGFSRQRGRSALAQRFGQALRHFKAQPAYARLLARYGLKPDTLQTGAG
jgi:polar amino acid transport system substrate-binding protein